jgi:hypothetical protein
LYEVQLGFCYECEGESSNGGYAGKSREINVRRNPGDALSTTLRLRGRVRISAQQRSQHCKLEYNINTHQHRRISGALQFDPDDLIN